MAAALGRDGPTGPHHARRTRHCSSRQAVLAGRRRARRDRRSQGRRQAARSRRRRCAAPSSAAPGRLFLTRQADEGLEQLVRRSDELARAGRRVEQPTEALLQARFSRLLKQDPQALRTFEALEPAEKRLVVEMGETAQVLARRYPGEAETMVRRLGPEGLTAVRVFGDDVAEVLVKEGPESLGVLRKTGRGGWSFFTQQVLPHKKKLAAAGVLAAFLANPEKFVDYAGQATEFAVREFARAGIQLASAVGGRGGARARNLDRPDPCRLRPRLPVPPLDRHGPGRRWLPLAHS